MAKTIDLSKYKSLWKTKKALELVKPEDWQEILRYYGPKTGKPIGKITRKALADRVFSEYCRLYYADEYGYVKCITSGVKMFWTKAQCGHFISRGVMKYRYDILNCYPQSYAENVMLSGNYKVYTLRMIDMLGKEKVEEMINDNETFDEVLNGFKEADSIVKRLKTRIAELEEENKKLKSDLSECECSLGFENDEVGFWKGEYKRLKKWIKDHCKGYGNLFPEDEMKRQWKKADKKRK